jgi:hypothetical protein
MLLLPSRRAGLCLWGLVATLVIPAAATPAHATKKRPVTIEVRLAVQVAERDILATVTFTNRSKVAQYVAKQMGCLDGELRSRVFDVRAGGRKIDYVGMMGKSAAPGPDGYVKLVPGEKVEATVHLEGAYDLPPGKHSYRIRYDAFHGRPDDESALAQLLSNEVRLSITR